MSRKRIDSLMVEGGLADTRAKAQALLMAGAVTVDGRLATKPGAMVPDGAEIRLREVLPYVGRGGTKLEHALDVFHLDVTALVAVDIGASTGGFTDCLLQRGATRVYAVDVCRGQIDYRLRTDPRVVVMEKVNARFPLPLPEKVDLATIDVSFISATRVVPNAISLLKPGGNIVLLLKPQFEARRQEVGKGGIVKDPQLHARVLGRFFAWVIDNGLRLKGLTTSPVEGASGNKEFLVLLTSAVSSIQGNPLTL